MYVVRQTREYAAWFRNIREKVVQSRIVARIERVQLGNLGDVKSVGDGVHELRLDFGPGYRVYFARAGETIILLLCGGDKSSQARDIVRAKSLALELE